MFCYKHPASADSGETGCRLYIKYVCGIAVRPCHTERFNKMFVARSKVRRFFVTTKRFQEKIDVGRKITFRSWESLTRSWESLIISWKYLTRSWESSTNLVFFDQKLRIFDRMLVFFDRELKMFDHHVGFLRLDVGFP